MCCLLKDPIPLAQCFPSFGIESSFTKKNLSVLFSENIAFVQIKILDKISSKTSKLEIKIGDEIKYNDTVIGKILIDEPFPFALIKLFDPEISVFKNNVDVQL